MSSKALVSVLVSTMTVLAAEHTNTSACNRFCFQSLVGEKKPNVPSGSPGEAPELRVTVNVYNGINLSADELGRAEREAERIFGYAGIQLTWTDGLLGRDVNNGTPSDIWNHPTLQLRIWPRAAAGKRPSGADTLGFCLSLENGDAVVLADAIRKYAVCGAPSFADLLGLAMAHELGHLLLRSASHSVTGMMRARWTEKGLRDDQRGYFRFTSGEAESIRQEVSRRMNLKLITLVR
jgi:hypothetical protein